MTSNTETLELETSIIIEFEGNMVLKRCQICEKRI